VNGPEQDRALGQVRSRVAHPGHVREPPRHGVEGPARALGARRAGFREHEVQDPLEIGGRLRGA
jgi:hypothetical protein